MSKVPPGLEMTVSRRGVWSFCALEESCLGPVSFTAPAMPFHHVAIRVDTAPLKMGWRMDGHRQTTSLLQHEVYVIAAGDEGDVWWNRRVNSSCLYFTDESLDAALGQDITDRGHELRSSISVHSPVMNHLLQALHADTVAGHPHGKLVGDSIFVALAAQFTPEQKFGSRSLLATPGDWRVRRSLEYIHAHLSQELSVPSIAKAAATSPFHLNRSFRAAMGCSLWQYVSRERARRSLTLMRNPTLKLVDISQLAGFETYSSFVMAVRREYGVTPARLRQNL